MNLVANRSLEKHTKTTTKQENDIGITPSYRQSYRQELCLNQSTRPIHPSNSYHYIGNKIMEDAIEDFEAERKLPFNSSAPLAAS